MQTSIAEPPSIEIREYPTGGDPSIGYVLVVIPQSPRAPHQVTVGGDLRYYGRGATGNRILTEGEVARLYRRREEWAIDREALLETIIAIAPHSAQAARNLGLGFLHAFTPPVDLDEGMWDRASANDRPALLEKLRQAATEPGPRVGYSPSLRGSSKWRRRGGDAWTLDTDDDPARYLVRCDINMDGRGQLFCGRAGQRIGDGLPTNSTTGEMVIFEQIIAGNLASFFSALGAFYDAAGYHGSVDIGVAVTGIQGGTSAHRRQALTFDPTPFEAEAYTRTARIVAKDLHRPEDLAGRLLKRLMEAVAGEGYDPFA